MSTETLQLIGFIYILIAFLTAMHCYSHLGNIVAEDTVSYLFGTMMVICTSVGAGILWVLYWFVWVIIFLSGGEDA